MFSRACSRAITVTLRRGEMASSYGQALCKIARASSQSRAKEHPWTPSTSRYHEVYARWQRDPQGFWGEAAAEIDWIEQPKTVFDPNAGVYGRWFPDGVCNTC